jgi:ubiquinone/menaquinone biosynthesis C-methylase UbiE
MGAETNDFLSRDAYYSPTPVLVSDRHGHIRDVNLAFEVLMGRAAEGCRDRPIESLLRSLGNRVHGCLIPPEAPPFSVSKGGAANGVAAPSPAQAGKVTLESGRFGSVQLLGTGVRRCDPLTGESIGMIYYWEDIETAASGALRTELLDRLAHQLTWEMYAVSYDRILPEMRYYQLVLRRHRMALAAPSIHRVADCGAGTGNLVELLLQDGKEVVALDVGRAMLSRLRSKPWAQTDRLTVFQQSTEHMPNLEDSSFDGVSILLALYDMQAPQDALEEAVRILRPGGRIVVTEPKRLFNIQIILDRCHQRLRRIGLYEPLEADMERVERANELLDPSQRASRSPMRAEDVLESLRQRGFMNLSIRDSHFRQCATVVGTKPAR